MLRGRINWRTAKILLLAAAAAAMAGAAAGAAWQSWQSRKETVTISIVGDIMLSRGVQEQLDQHGYDYPYEEVRTLFLQDDLTIGNLECPITTSTNAADKTKRFVFQADEQNAAALKAAGFDCLSLANNHSMDYLSEGLGETMVNLKRHGLDFAGAAEQASLLRPWRFEKNGIRIGLLAYSAFPPEGFFYNGDKPTIQYVSTMDLSPMEQEIAGLDCDFLIVYFHWGVEYQSYKSEAQKLMAQRAVEAGADLVVGTHPHVLQPAEIYQGKPIYYSLGNFVFDKQIPPGTDQSMILQITVDKAGRTKIEEIPVTIKNGRPVLN